MESRLLAYLRLSDCEHLAALLCTRLIQQMGSIASLSTAADAAILGCGVRGYQLDALRRVLATNQDTPGIDAVRRWNEDPNHHLLCFEDAAYPPLLREIAVPPLVLFVCGQLEVLSRTQIAIVGSRRASNYGLRTAYWLAHELGTAELVVSSGLARGIDSRAHAGALDAGAPTIAIIGTGIDSIYPPSNKELAAAIENNGALVSEFPLGTPPKRENFPRRNRIMSGMSIGTVVVEGALRSGSLITARLAVEQNREVFAVPGPITNQNSAGCHQLIREGALLVQQPGDILDELGLKHPAGQDSVPIGPGTSGRNNDGKQAALRASLLELIGEEGCELETLIVATGLGYQSLLGHLLELELSNRLQQLGGRYYVR